LIIALLFLLAPPAARAAGEPPAALHAGLAHLLEQARPEGAPPPDPARIEPLLAFATAGKPEEREFRPPELDGASAAYHEFTLGRDLAGLIQLILNPDFPSFALSPSSTRLSYWSRVESDGGRLPRLWERLGDLPAPIVVRGVEHEEITPDLSSGAYYAYDLNRALILLRHGGRPVLISVSRQAGKSDVGRKGLVLGADENWDYLYSGREGLSRPGMGWVSSYMYDSFGVAVYWEPEAGRPLVRCALFKWLRAGWSGLNVVRGHHILEGMKRYARDFKAVVENPGLPAPPELARAYAAIARLPEEDLRHRTRTYLEALDRRYPHLQAHQNDWCDGCLDNGQYLAALDRRDMQALVFLEYLKGAMGREKVLPLGDLLSLRRTAAAIAIP
jgi:hypothetical protein